MIFNMTTLLGRSPSHLNIYLAGQSVFSDGKDPSALGGYSSVVVTSRSKVSEVTIPF